MRISANFDSTSLRSCAYDSDSRKLDITFRNGGVYTYEDVPEDVFESLRDAPSPGIYFHQNIKNKYA